MCYGEHAIRRAAERHGLRLTPDDIQTLEYAIAVGLRFALTLGTNRQGSTLVAFRHDRRWIPLVCRGGHVVTVMDPGTSLLHHREALGRRERELIEAGHEAPAKAGRLSRIRNTQEADALPEGR